MRRKHPSQAHSAKWKGAKVYLFQRGQRVWTDAKEIITSVIHEHESFNFLISLESVESAVEVRRELYSCT